MLDNSITKEEFVKSFEDVLKVVHLIEENLFERINAKMESVDSEMADAKSTIAQASQQLAQAIADSKAANETSFAQMRQNAKENVSALFDKLSVNRRFTDLMNGVESRLASFPTAEEFIALIPKKEETKAEQVRDLLESITVEEDKLSIDAIKGLRKELGRLTRETSRSGVIPFTRGAVRAVDLSASLDGSAKTFSLPAFWIVVSVHASSSPNAFRATTDYTTDASAFTITFTSEINEATTLASGQTLIVTIAEP